MSALLLPALALGGVLFFEMSKDNNDQRRPKNHRKRRRLYDDLEEDEDDVDVIASSSSSTSSPCGTNACNLNASSPSAGSQDPLTSLNVNYNHLPGVYAEGDPMKVLGMTRETADQAVRRSIYTEYGDAKYKGLDNKMHTIEHFLDHQNPAPFAKPKQEGFLANSESSAGLRLDARTGESRLRISKKEMGSLFEPTMAAKNIYGAPSATNEIQARMMESVSKRMDGVSPLGAQIHVGPGTQRNQAASNLGFNAANEFRDLNNGKGYVKTVDDLRVKSKANLANKEGLQGVAEMPHKVYNMEAGLREGRDKPRELEIGSGHWTATSTTAKKGHAMNMYVAGLESRKKTNDSSLEYFGASSAPHQFYNDHTMEHREECRRKGNEGAPMYLGNANYLDQSGNGDLHRSAQNSRPLNHRSFNEKYMDGTENTFFGAATSMVQSAFVHFFGGDVVHTKKEEMVGNPRPLFNVDSTQRLGGTIYDPKAYRDNVSFKEMNHFSFVGNPDRGMNSDAYLTASITEALKPREMQKYLDSEGRQANANATASVPQPRFDGTVQVPTNASLTKEAVDIISARGEIGGGNMAKMNTLGHTMGMATASRKEDSKKETSMYQSTPNMAWANQNMARHALFGESTKTQKENVKAVDQSWKHPSEDFKMVEKYMNENPFLVSRSKFMQTV